MNKTDVSAGQTPEKTTGRGLGASPEDLGNSLAAAFALIERCCTDMLAHDGFGELRVETRILKRGQKEIIVHFGKQYRFVVDQT